MPNLLRKLLGSLLCVVLVLSAAAQPETKSFPAPNSLAAKKAIQTGLNVIGSNVNDALNNLPRLKQLAGELAKQYNPAPTLEEVKQGLLAMDQVGAPLLQVQDPDNAPLLQTFFARQNQLREPNPSLKEIREQTWPPTLNHGERVALQAYSQNAFGSLNQELRTTGKPSKANAKLHERLQSAFGKAKPFHPPIKIARGAKLAGKTLTDFLNEVNTAQKNNSTFTMKGYLSCTVGDKVLAGFDGNINAHIHAVLGLDLLPVSLFPQENEFVLNHNSKFKVIQFKHIGTKYILECEQVLK
jgi:hypothetical protein